MDTGPQPIRPWVVIAVFGWEISAGADVMTPTAGWMMEHGGNFGPLTLDGQQWRLFTSMFLHYGVIHLVMNMVGLLDGGRHVERMYGHAGFVALYLVSGLAGSLASGMRGNAVSAGASGAIFGIFGAFGAYLLLHRDRLDTEQVTKQARGLGIFLAYNIYFGLAMKGIDLVAHIGGLVAGFACGIALEIGTDEGHSTTRRSLLVGVLGTALVFGATFMLPKPNNAMLTFGPAESAILDKWNTLVKQVQAGSVEDDKLADAIEAELLPPWRKARAEYEKTAEGPLRAQMLEYLAAREDGWTMMVTGLRAHDVDATTAAMKRFSEADALIGQMSKTE
jgi:rhomboid protease GluP